VNRVKWTVGTVVVIGLLGLIAWPVYASCGKCAGDCKKIVKMLDDGKLTLGKAIEAAETHSKGRALAAYSELEGDTLEVAVYCLVGDKIMEVEVDGKTGKAGEMKETKALALPHEH
jgi:hypothetical protein